MKFIESICFKEGDYVNLEFHNQRWVKTHEHFFDRTPTHISKFLPEISENGTFKVRLVYDDKEKEVSYQSYLPKEVTSLSVVQANAFDYSFKFENRRSIEQLQTKKEKEEIIICIDGKITDSSYANLAFWDGSDWLTPDTPLLEGVRRAQLLAEGKIKPQAICTDDLASFKKVSLINAMLDLEEVVVPISSLNLTS